MNVLHSVVDDTVLFLADNVQRMFTLVIHLLEVYPPLDATRPSLLQMVELIFIIFLC